MPQGRPSRVGLAGVTALVTVVALVSCTGDDTDPASSTVSPSTSPSGSSSPASSSASGTPTSSPAAHVARIGVLATLGGERGAVGRGLRSSVELAVREANESGAVPGWRFEVVAVDDGGKQSEGQQVASRLAGTSDLIGVVGSLTSAVDEGVQPIFNNAGVPMLAPAAGAAHLTRRDRGSEPVRPYPTYFRLAPLDAAEGVAAARFAALDGRDRVVVVDDGTAYGRAFVDDFGTEAGRRGVRVLRSRTLVPRGADTEVTSKEALARADRLAATVVRVDKRLRRDGRRLGAVVVGGTGEAASVVAEALTDAGARPPVLGGDALLSRDFGIDEGGRRGDLAVFAGVTADAPSAEGFSRRYLAAGFDATPGVFGPTGYDAASALVESFGAVVGVRDTVGDGVRSAMLATLAQRSFEGATGTLAFDVHGDRVRPRLTKFRLTRSGRWRAMRSVPVGARSSTAP